MDYLNETVDESSLRDKIMYKHKVISANWISKKSIWELEVLDNLQNKTITCNFLFLCGGYYSYDNAYQPQFHGQKNFQGPIIHPQFWDETLDYSNKQVVVIGSGATAVTIVPALTDKAKHVVMLQRSPSYLVSAPAEDAWSKRLNKILPIKLSYFLVRWKNILAVSLLFYLSRRFPNRIKEKIINSVREELGDDFDIEKHFTPKYNPWDQRMCLVPDSDFFNSINKIYGIFNGTSNFILTSMDKNNLEFKTKPRWPLDESAPFLKGPGVQL